MTRPMPIAAALLGIALLAGGVATPAHATGPAPDRALVHEAGVKIKSFSHRGFGHRRGGFGVRKFGFNRFGGKKVFVAPKHGRRFGHRPTVKKFVSPFSPGIIVIK